MSPRDQAVAAPANAPIPRALPVVGAPSPRSVRVSVTDRCDYACIYCRPSRADGYVDGRLSQTAWQTMFAGLRRAGVRRVRLTGGEPLLHPEIVSIVECLASLGFADLALTTNGSQLARLAAPLRQAGLERINVSLDTLDEVRFHAMTRGGALAPVLAGIEAAAKAGLSPIKLNTVVLRGINDDEVERLTLWAWERGLVPRFIELMPIGEGAALFGAHVVTTDEVMRHLADHVRQENAQSEPGLGPARYVRARRDPSLRVGFISGSSDTFCSACDRLRVSSTGDLRPCLATEDGVSAAEDARAGRVEAISDRIAEAWARKPDGRSWRGCAEDSAARVSMRAIGG